MPTTDAPHRRDTLGLLVILCGIALVVVVARTIEMAQSLSAGTGSAHWPNLLSTEGAIWAGWALWAAAMIPIMRRLVERDGPRWRTILTLVALAVVPILAVPIVASPVHHWAFPQSGTLPSAYLHMASHNALTNLLLGTAVTGVAHSYLSLRRARALEVTAARLNAQLAGAQLDTLRAQLDPHFLFNALNSIAVLARRSQAADVEQMVAHLAGLLRHSLDSQRAQLVTLDTELAALAHYLEIERVRHGERLAVTMDVPDALRARIVPSFVLQPLVENAIRHGMTDPNRPLRVTVRAEVVGDGLRLVVADDGAGLGAATESRGGLGLGNTRARLDGLYAGRASLTLGPGEGGRGARVIIDLPAEARS